ncbi:c-type cytochrome [Rhodocyclaceae bacterium SMB388]
MSIVYRLPSWPVLLACATLLTACGRGGPSDGIDPNDAAQVALGEGLYARHCASCHGTELEGQPDWRSRLQNGRLPAPPHDQSGHTWHHRNADLIAMTRDGLVPPLAPAGYESDMPAYAGVLSDAEIRAVFAYIQSTWPPEVWEIRRKMLENR